MICNVYSIEFLIKKGYIAFAEWSDWGLVCFKTNRNNKDSNYAIVTLYHEIDEKVNDEYKAFYDLLI